MIGIVRNEALAGKIIRGSWLDNPKLKDIGYAVIRKHNFTCSICGTQSRSSKKHPNGMMVPACLEHSGLAAITLAKSTCLCPLCASSLATNWSVVGTVLKGEPVPAPGFLVYLPFKSQEEVIRLATYTLVCLQKPNDHPLFSVATDIDIVMTGLADEVSKKIPIYDGTNADFVKALALLPDEYYNQRSQIIGALRWWPNMNYWTEFGRYISAATFDEFEKDFGLDTKTSVLMQNNHEESE